jgi:hypothetical protein
MTNPLASFTTAELAAELRNRAYGAMPETVDRDALADASIDMIGEYVDGPEQNILGTTVDDVMQTTAEALQAMMTTTSESYADEFDTDL